MEYAIIVLTLCAALGLGVTAGFDYARRQFTRKRNLYRMGQALRRGLSQPGGPWSPAPRVVEWHACESTSANWY